MGTAWREHYERLAWTFKCRQSCIGHHKKCGALRALLQYPYLRLSRFQGVSPLQRRENSSRDSCQRIQDRLRYRTEPQLLHYDPISASRFGNINPIPFRPKSGIIYYINDNKKPAFRTAFAYRLGPTDPCSNAVHMEPFSTSAFKVLF
jgi:hypothetical protein